MGSARITIIGSAGTHCSAERVCSSYLISHEGTNLLLDLGPGALHNLQKVMDVADLHGIIISHMHPDHFLGLYGLNYAVRFHPDKPGPIPVYGPESMAGTIAALLPQESMEKMGDLLTFNTVHAGETLVIGSLEVELFAMNHPIATVGSRIRAGESIIAYTGDTAPSPVITDLARDADLLLCDTTWSERERPLPADVHCTAAEAGKAAAAAGVRRLVITHVAPTNDPDQQAAEAADHFDGDIIVAVDLQEITI